jgi:DNA-binding NarL/FixJ family response regulator
MQEVKEIIFAQEGVSLAVKRSALKLYKHEMDKLDDMPSRRPSARKVLSNILKWMAGQAAKEKYSRRLTSIELEILQLLVEGMPQKQIALELGCSHKRVKRHFSQIRRKVNVWSTYQAVAVAVERGWVKVPKLDD